jgi:hypothetical protein
MQTVSEERKGKEVQNERGFKWDQSALYEDYI